MTHGGGLLYNWVRRRHVDAAGSGGVGAGAAGEEDVAGQTPACAPGVLDDPVVLAVLSAVADGQDTVVELWVSATAAAGGHDSRGVQLPSSGGGINGDGDWLLNQGGLESNFVVHIDVAAAGDGGRGGASALGAGAVGGGVWVSSLSAETLVLDDPGEGVLHQTSAAALVAGGLGAVNKLLLGERSELASLEEDGTFDGAGGGKRPARSALSLVLDGGDGTLGAPINGGGESLRGNSGRGHAGGGIHAGVILVVEGAELVQGEVSELVDGQSVGGVLGGVVANDVEVGLEDVVSLEELVSGFVFALVSFDEASEFALVLALSEGRRDDGGSKAKENEGDGAHGALVL